MSAIAKKLASQTAAYGISTIVGRALNYLLVPFYTKMFAPEEYGIVTELYAYVAFFNIIYTYGMETAFFRFANKPDYAKQETYNRVQSLLLSSSLLFSGILIAFSGQIASLLEYPDKAHYIVWLAIILATDAIVAIPFARLRLDNKAIRFASLRLLNVLLIVTANIFFLYFCQHIYQGDFLPALQPYIARIYDPELRVGYVFLVNLGVNLLYIPMLWREFIRFRFKLDFAWLKPLLKYAYPLMFMGLAGMVNEVLDRILLKEWLPEGFYPGTSNLAAVGIYGACYKLSIFMTLTIQAFRYAAEPFFFSQSQDKNSPKMFAKVMKWFMICCAFIFLFISANLEDFQMLLGQESYRAGIRVVPILLLANLFLGAYYNLSVWFKLTDKTHYGTYISFGGAALTILLNWFLIPKLGYMGCAITTLICYFTMAAVCLLLGNRHYPVPYPVKAISSYLMLAIVLTAASFLIEIEDFILRHIFHILLCGLFLLSIYAFEKPKFIKQFLTRR
ncbi:polysaccharide biosynthesis C-terminal domain-containing protein [Adhaeribacter sp. BT258]|uniref:Polysaccharide biosynthesis C-terminal domain-containing protein n=1 Tax=Adhaeribacter terrigena TaxID=2793070 RepID=A0ABS1BWZ0_9BACT|nr:polysaccharide biosynthesis C-terminal domain-containing protein [Adhaeribacter terrigena]MBK0401597.1 polysaccharide biosynthesis C-terminal domain-containing protein [Adhaeribacter terrigena]